MRETVHGCFKCVGEKRVIKHGKTKQGKQRYLCKRCGKSFLTSYTYSACYYNTNSQLTSALKEGMGIRSISRHMNVSPTTIISRIKTIASKIIKPIVYQNRVYELDEMCTWIGAKSNYYWIAYAIGRKTKSVVDFKVGKRTNKTLRHVVNTLVLSNPKKIFTDKLRNYKYLIPKELHSTKWRGTNGIEANNLSLRTNLKRLQRRTVCFSKSQAMLVVCLKIFFYLPSVSDR